MHPVPGRFVRAFSFFLLLARVIAGCGGETPAAPPKPKPKSCMPGELTRDDGTCQPAGLPPDMPCPPGELALEDGTCQPAGLPPDMPCPPGELAVNGGCQPAGVPPSACGQGFMPDGKQGCEPILPAAPCPDGQMAVPGETVCHEVAPCGQGTWGAIPVDADTQFVDQAYAGGGSDGTQAKPWTTVQQGINAAKPGAIVAVAAGKYVEDLVIQGKAVRLFGRCPAMVEVSGTKTALQVLGQAAGGTEIRDLAVTGMGLGTTVQGASGVVIARVWAHDTPGDGLDIMHGLSATSVSLTGSLIEHTAERGVLVQGADATIEASVVRNTVPNANGMLGRGFNILDDAFTKVRANVTIRACLVEQNHDEGVAVFGSDATIESSVVRSTLLDATGNEGVGILIHGDPSTKVRANVTIRTCLVEQNHAIGVAVIGSDATIEASVVRSTLLDATGNWGMGILIQSDPATKARANGTIRACLVEQNHMDGVNVTGSDATIEATVVRDTRPTAQGDDGFGIAIGPDGSNARANVTVRACLVEKNRKQGVLVAGSDATIEATVVRSTLPGADGNGRGVRIEENLFTKARGNVTIDACLVEQNHLEGVVAVRSDLIVRSSIVAENHVSGVALVGANATIEATVLRDTLPDAQGMFGHGLEIQADSKTKARSNAAVRACLIEQNHEMGVGVFGSDMTIDATVIRSNTSDEQAHDGWGIAIQQDSTLMERSNVTLSACLVEQNRYVGVSVVGSDATIESSVVRDTLPDAQDGFGVGIFIQYDLDTGARSSATVRACLIEQNRVLGVGVNGSDATIEATTVRDTMPGADGRFGDGISIFGTMVTIQDTKVTNNARAGVSSFGATVVITASTLTCNGFDLEGEATPEADFSFDGSNGWQCSLRGAGDCEKLGACHVETAGIEAPSWDLPPPEPTMP